MLTSNKIRNFRIIENEQEKKGGGAVRTLHNKPVSLTAVFIVHKYLNTKIIVILYNQLSKTNNKPGLHLKLNLIQKQKKLL